MKMMKTKGSVLAVLLFVSISSRAFCENPMYYNVALQPVSHDWRVPGLVAGGISVATAAALLKLVSAFMQENGLSKSSGQKAATKEEIKNQFDQVYSYCKRLVPSISTALLVGGLMVALCSKQLVNFYEGCYKSWAFDLLNPNSKIIAEKAIQKNIAALS